MIGSGRRDCPPGGSTFSTVPSLEPRNKTVVFLCGPATPSTATWVSRALQRQASGENSIAGKASPDACFPFLLLHKPHPHASGVYLWLPAGESEERLGGGRRHSGIQKWVSLDEEQDCIR